MPLGIHQHDPRFIPGKLKTALPQWTGYLQLVGICLLLPQSAGMPALITMGQGNTTLQLPVAEFCR